MNATRHNLESPTPVPVPRITGIMLIYNEVKYVAAAVRSLGFCDEILVVDLGGDGVEIARPFATRIIKRDLKPIPEMTWPSVIPEAQNDWIVLLDPDEILPQGVENFFNSAIHNNPNVAIVELRTQFFFKGKPLYNTAWGIPQTKRMFFNRKRVEFRPILHRGHRPEPGYESFSTNDSQYIMKHYWCDSYRELILKRKRYIQFEGHTWYDTGMRFSWKGLIKGTLINWMDNYIKYKGYKTVTGHFLSAIRTLHFINRMFAVKKYASKIKH